MKKLLPICAFAFLVSCGDSNEDKIIKDYVQTLGKAKLSLDVKILENLEIDPIVSSDSIKHIDSLLQEIGATTRRNDTRKVSLVETKINFLEIDRRLEKSSEIRKLIDTQIEAQKNLLNVYNSSIKEIEAGNYENLNEETRVLAEKKKKYLLAPNKTLALKYRCKYKFKNPSMNGIETEVSKIFVIDTLKTKVFTSK
jgi:hypothetical protein